MTQPGDILDEFDDDGLRKSIETANKTGQWKDAQARFADPKLEAIAKQLATVPTNTYQERRLAELERRAAEKAAKESATSKSSTTFGGSSSTQAFGEQPATPATPVTEAEAWRATIGKPEARLPLPGLAGTSASSDDSDSPLRWAQTVGAALVVFMIAASVQLSILGWTTELTLRAVGAGLASGIIWQLFACGRFRCAGIGASFHLVTFLTYARSDSSTAMFATSLGALIVLLGSAAVGIWRESGAMGDSTR